MLHELLDKAFLYTFLTLGADHIAASFVERVNLLRGQIVGDLAHRPNDFVNERLMLSWLQGYKVTPALVGNFDECIACHVLDTFRDVSRTHSPYEKNSLTFMGLVHKLEEFVDDRFQELPMRLKEAWVLANNVHDVACNDSFVVFSSLHLRQSQ